MLINLLLKVTYLNTKSDFKINIHSLKIIENYWVRVRAVGACSGFQLEQYAILSYATTGTSLSLAVPRVFPQYTDDFGRKAVRQ